MMHIFKRLLRILLVTAVAVGAFSALAACGGSDNTSTPIPSATAAISVLSTTATPTIDPDAWRNNYAAGQLAAYDQALARFTAYETESEPIWAAGRATPAAQRLFKSYFPSPVWESYYARLKGYQQVDVELHGLPSVLWSRAKTISPDSKTVTLLQCVDYTPTSATQRGTTVSKDPVYAHPLLRTVQVDKPNGSDWLIYELGEPTPTNHKGCTASAG